MTLEMEEKGEEFGEDEALNEVEGTSQAGGLAHAGTSREPHSKTEEKTDGGREKLVNERWEKRPAGWTWEELRMRLRLRMEGKGEWAERIKTIGTVEGEEKRRRKKKGGILVRTGRLLVEIPWVSQAKWSATRFTATNQWNNAVFRE